VAQTQETPTGRPPVHGATVRCVIRPLPSRGLAGTPNCSSAAATRSTLAWQPGLCINVAQVDMTNLGGGGPDHPLSSPGPARC